MRNGVIVRVLRGENMTIYYDKIGHLVSDSSLEELHSFAQSLGLRKEWFQDHPKHPHYDLTTERIKNKAKKLGAKKVSSKEIIILLRKLLD